MTKTKVAPFYLGHGVDSILVDLCHQLMNVALSAEILHPSISC